MLRPGGTNCSLKMEGASCSTTEPCFGLKGASRSNPDSSLDPLRDDRSLNRLGFLSEPLGEAGESEENKMCFYIAASVKSAVITSYVCLFISNPSINLDLNDIKSEMKIQAEGNVLILSNDQELQLHDIRLPLSTISDFTGRVRAEQLSH